MNTHFTPWLNLPLWAVWHRVSPVEHITLDDKPLAEVVMQVAPDATPLDGFPYGWHLRQTPDGVEVAPAARNWRNARGEIGLGWVAWQNALIDDPERQCKDVIDAAAPVQWVLAAVYYPTRYTRHARRRRHTAGPWIPGPHPAPTHAQTQTRRACSAFSGLSPSQYFA